MGSLLSQRPPSTGTDPPLRSSAAGKSTVPCIPECTLRGEDPSPGQPPSRHWGCLGPSPPLTAAAPTVAASFPRGHLGGSCGELSLRAGSTPVQKGSGLGSNKRLHSCTGKRGEHTMSYSTLRLQQVQ